VRARKVQAVKNRLLGRIRDKDTRREIDEQETGRER
jgi:hypothetical protein